MSANRPIYAPNEAAARGLLAELRQRLTDDGYACDAGPPIDDIDEVA